MSPFAEASGLPLSSDSSSASSSPFALISSASAYISPARFDGETLRSGPSSAARAAATARSTSSAPAWATSQIGSPVAGSMVAKVRPSAASGRSPPISRACGGRADELARGVGEGWDGGGGHARIVWCARPAAAQRPQCPSSLRAGPARAAQQAGAGAGASACAASAASYSASCCS